MVRLAGIRKFLKDRRTRLIAGVGIILAGFAGILLMQKNSISMPSKNAPPPRDSEREPHVDRMASLRAEMRMARDKELFGLPRLKRSDDPSFDLPFIGHITAETRDESVTVDDSEGIRHTFPLRTFYDESGNWIRTEFWAKGAEINVRSMEAIEKLYQHERITLAKDKPPVTVGEAIGKAMTNFQLWEATHFTITRVIVSYVGINDPPPPSPFLLIELYGATNQRGGSAEPLLNRLRVKINLETDLTGSDENL